MLNRILIDPLVFAAEKTVLQDVVALQELDARIHLPDMLDMNCKVAFQVVGGIDPLQRPFLDLFVSGSLKLCCQRCMKPTDFELDENARIVLFVDEAKLDDAMLADEALEGILLDGELDVLALVEDQILMALPISPKHDDCGNIDAEKVSQSQHNPFAILSGLKKG